LWTYRKEEGHQYCPQCHSAAAEDVVVVVDDNIRDILEDNDSQDNNIDEDNQDEVEEEDDDDDIGRHTPDLWWQTSYLEIVSLFRCHSMW